VVIDRNMTTWLIGVAVQLRHDDSQHCVGGWASVVKASPATHPELRDTRAHPHQPTGPAWRERGVGVVE